MWSVHRVLHIYTKSLLSKQYQESGKKRQIPFPAFLSGEILGKIYRLEVCTKQFFVHFILKSKIVFKHLIAYLLIRYFADVSFLLKMQ